MRVPTATTLAETLNVRTDFRESYVDLVMRDLNTWSYRF